MTLTVTEKAYLRAGDGSLDIDHADLRADLAQPQRPKTAHRLPGARRSPSGLPPARRHSPCCPATTCRRTARRCAACWSPLPGCVDPALGDRIAADVAFPSRMVDRIVPATTEADRDRIASALGVEDAWPVMTEPFPQWVVEDAFPLGRPGWERSGVTMVRRREAVRGDEAPAAQRRAFGDRLSRPAWPDTRRWPTPSATPAIRRFVGSLWARGDPDASGDAGLDPYVYTSELTRRFDNTALAHRTAQIANDGSQKLPQRIVAPALAALAKGAPADRLMTVVAAWTAACEARGRSLPAGHFTDPLDARLATIAERGAGAAETVAAVFDATGFAAGRAERPRLEALAAEALGLLRVRGVAGLLAEGA